MANYYYTTIKSDKMTQKIAAEIFNKLAEERKVRYFNYNENQLKFNTHGLVDIQNVLDKHNIKEEEMKVKDEFELVYENINNNIVDIKLEKTNV